MSLVITYNDGSNPFFIANASKMYIDKHIRWQKKHNGHLIKEIYVTKG